MFFSWYAKNRHFKKGGNLSGQIAPFLLVALVILLVATTATIRIGKVGVDKTCADNMADAGALAAASTWDAYLNLLLVPANCDLFLGFLAVYFYIEDDTKKAEDALKNASTYLQNALAYTVAAEAGMVVGQIAVEVFIGGCAAVWVHMGAAAVLYYLAMDEMGKAQLELFTAYGALASCEEWTKWYKEEYGQPMYCSIRTGMMDVYTDAPKNGQDLALANGCAASKEASIVNMPDIVYYDIAHTEKNYPDDLDISIADIVVGMLGNAVAALPGEVQGALNRWGVVGKIGGLIGSLFPGDFIEDDYFGVATAQFLYDACNTVSTILLANVWASGLVLADTVAMIAADACCASVVGSAFCCWIVPILCALAWVGAIAVFADTLFLIAAELAMQYGVNDILLPKVEDIRKTWSWGSPLRIFQSYNCDDVKNVPTQGGKGQPIDGLIIIDIYDIILSGWTVTCNASQEGVSSWSTAQFDGGNVAQGGYYPRIIATD